MYYVRIQYDTTSVCCKVREILTELGILRIISNAKFSR